MAWLFFWTTIDFLPAKLKCDEKYQQADDFSTMRTIVGKSGRGSVSQIYDFMAKAWLRSCMMEEPSPQSSPMMMTAPPFPPPEDKLESASLATLVPAVDFHVTAPRIGYITEAESMAAAVASDAEVSKCTPSSAI
jgi:hypothetical protein